MKLPNEPRTKRWLISLGAGIAAALAGCAGAIDLPAAGDVKHGIADLRRLSFTQDVPFVIRSNEVAQQMMFAKLTRDNTEEELRLSSAAGVMKGLFPPGTELKSAE